MDVSTQTERTAGPFFSDYINVQGRLKDGSASNLYFERFINSVVELKTGRFGIDIQGSPLSQRAWTYQEQVLSSRILYFAESQLYWECDHCRLSEDNLPQAHAEREYPVLTLILRLWKALGMSGIEALYRRTLSADSHTRGTSLQQ